MQDVGVEANAAKNLYKRTDLLTEPSEFSLNLSDIALKAKSEVQTSNTEKAYKHPDANETSLLVTRAKVNLIGLSSTQNK